MRPGDELAVGESCDESVRRARIFLDRVDPVAGLSDGAEEGTRGTLRGSDACMFP